jgi:hypothetical protein
VISQFSTSKVATWPQAKSNKQHCLKLPWLSTQTQLGYVRVHIAFEMNGGDYMFVRWYTGADANRGESRAVDIVMRRSISLAWLFMMTVLSCVRRDSSLAWARVAAASEATARSGASWPGGLAVGERPSSFT